MGLKHWLTVIFVVAVVAGFGIGASTKCGEATWVDTYAIVVLAHEVIPSFNICETYPP